MNNNSCVTWKIAIANVLYQYEPQHKVRLVLKRNYYCYLSLLKYRSASMAALQPLPAATTACL